MVKSISVCNFFLLGRVLSMDSVVFSIGICDDDTKWHKAVSESCSRFFDNKEIEFEISSYYRGNDLIQDNSKEIDILFLDVEMDSMDGLAVMKEAEKMSNIHNIVFVSSHPEAVWDSFGYKTKGFITKPFTDDDIFKYLDIIYKKKINDSLVEFSDYNGTVYIRKSDMVYIKADSNYCTVYTEEGERVVSCTLKECERMLNGLPFLRIHKSYIVNLDYIKNMTGTTASFKSGETCTIGRIYRAQVREEYQKYLRRELHT